MSAKDLHHSIVKEALEKDGWTVNQDPLFIKFLDKHFFIDLGAEKMFIAERKTKKIAIEIKSFLNSSNITDFHQTVGQYINYKTILKEKQSVRKLYIALDKDNYNKLQESTAIRFMIIFYRIKFIIFDLETKEIIQWKN